MHIRCEQASQQCNGLWIPTICVSQEASEMFQQRCGQLVQLRNIVLMQFWLGVELAAPVSQLWLWATHWVVIDHSVCHSEEIPLVAMLSGVQFILKKSRQHCNCVMTYHQVISVHSQDKSVAIASWFAGFALTALPQPFLALLLCTKAAIFMPFSNASFVSFPLWQESSLSPKLLTFFSKFEMCW